MTENRDLLSYLEEQAGSGLRDSEGEFTISIEDARSKLARFSLPRTEAWVLKMVQAAFGWNIQKILINQSWKETRFYLKPETGSQLPEEKQILAALVSGQVLTDSPLADFCLALRAVVEQAGLSFLLVVNDGHSLSKPIYAGRYFGRLSEEKRLARSRNQPVGLTLTVRHHVNLGSEVPLTRLVGLQSNGLPVLEELLEHAYLSPIPLVCRGRNLEGLLNSPHFRFKWQIPLAFSGIKELEHSPPSMPVPKSFEEKQLSYLTDPRRAGRTYNGEKEFACIYSISALARGAAPSYTSKLTSFHWVRNGVVVQRATLPFETRVLGLQIYANAENLKTDLTGFQIVQDEARDRRMGEIFEAVGGDILKWRDRIPDFFRRDLDELSSEDARYRRKELVKLKGPAVAGVSFVAAIFGGLNPAFGMAGACAGIGAVMLRKTEIQKAAGRGSKLSDVLDTDLLLIADGLLGYARSLEVRD